MAHIERRETRGGQTRYRAQVRLKGARPLQATFDRKADAREWAAQVESDMRRGRLLPGASVRTHTLAEAIDRYEARVLPKKAPDTIRAQTWQTPGRQRGVRQAGLHVLRDSVFS